MMSGRVADIDPIAFRVRVVGDRPAAAPAPDRRNVARQGRPRQCGSIVDFVRHKSFSFIRWRGGCVRASRPFYFRFMPCREVAGGGWLFRSEELTSEIPSLMRRSYAVLYFKK